jgi:hypothetical protein
MPHLADEQPTAMAARPQARRRRPALWLRIRVWAGSLGLDCQLAEGASPANSPELSLRAQQLSSHRSRHALSGTLMAAVEAARRSPPPTSARSAIAVAEVRAAAEPLQSLAHELVALDDPPIRGVALASFLVCEPTSPLYNRRSPVTLRELAQRARSALRQSLRQA